MFLDNLEVFNLKSISSPFSLTMVGPADGTITCTVSSSTQFEILGAAPEYTISSRVFKHANSACTTDESY